MPRRVSRPSREDDEAFGAAYRMVESRSPMDRTIDIRARILEEATRLFATQGFDGTSVQAIADAVGIRKPSLLYHFASKELLHHAVLDAMFARWDDVLPALLRVPSGAERFERVMGSLTSFFTEDPDRARLLLREILDRPEQMRERIERFARPWLDVITVQLEEAKSHALVQESIDPEAYAMNVLSMVVAGIATMESLLLAFRGDSTEHGKRRFVEELVRVARASVYRHDRPSRTERQNG